MGMSLGSIIGLVVGSFFSHPVIGLVAGMMCGLIIGTALPSGSGGAADN